MEFVDEVREGDGVLIIYGWRFLLLQFKASERTKYSIEASTLLAQHDVATAIITQIRWNSTINTHG